MQFFKSLIRGLASLGLKFGLIALAITSATVIVFGTSLTLKDALRGSKIYDNLVDNIISVNQQEGTAKESSYNLSLAEPQIKQAAQSAFSPSLIQSSTEQVIDGVYNWLQGKSIKPDFKIDLTVAKFRFAEAAGDSAVTRARQLPPCNLQQSRELARSDIDPFGMTCLPSGLDVSLIRNKVISDLTNNENFIKDPVITADSLPKNSQGKTIFDNLSNAPKVFHWIILAPWIIGGLTLLTVLLIIMLYDEKLRGLRTIGITLLGSGVFLLIATWIFNFALKQANKPNRALGKLGKNALQNNFLALLNTLSSAFNSKLFVFGAIYASLGAATLVSLHFVKPKAVPTTLLSTPAEPVAELSNPPQEQVDTTPKEK